MTAVQRSHRMTVEEAWRAKQGAASMLDGRPTTPDEPSSPASTESGDSSESPSAPRRVMIDASAPSTASHTVAGSGPSITLLRPRPEVRPPARPRIEPDPAILGLSRHMRSRLGARLFNLFFAFVFVLILIQMVVALLVP